jgi:protein kinase C substrate 80K-H
VFTKEYYEKLLPVYVSEKDDVQEVQDNSNILTEQKNDVEQEEILNMDDEKGEPEEDDVKHDIEEEPETENPPHIPIQRQRGVTITSSNTNKYNEDTLALIDQANSAKNLLHETETKLRSTEDEISSNQKKLDYDVGPNFEYTSLIDHCFEFDDREYIYKLCPFDRTVQKSKSNNQETSIGRWSSWDDEKKYAIMKFENGQNCWNGPDRSTKVYLTCGSDNKLIAVSEPNRCEYEFKFETPCACDEKDLQKLLNDSDHDEL